MRFEEFLTNEYGGGQYFTPEEDELFKERTYDSLKKLEKMGWKVEWSQPSFSGTLYRLWNEGRSRALYLSERKLYKGKATVGKFVDAQKRLKLLRHREAPMSQISQQVELIKQLKQDLSESIRLDEQPPTKLIDPNIGKYKTLNDAAKLEDGLGKGSTEIWYMKPEYFRDFNMGWKFLIRHHGETTGKLKFSEIPQKSHILLGKIKEKNPGNIFRMMQGEIWSPYGEANNLIRKKGLHHTSMSVGDIIKVGNKILMVDMSGFKDISKIVKAKEQWRKRF